MLGWAILLAASLIWPAATDAQTASPPLILEAKIPLGQVSGSIDHLGIDLKQQRLLVAELGNNSLGVVGQGAAQDPGSERAAGRCVCPVFRQPICGECR